MTIAPSIGTIVSNLRYATPPSRDNQRKRISGRLLGICDTVFIPEYNYNGTIIDIIGHFVIVLPHDYGPSIRRLPQSLQYGKDISCHQRFWLDQINVAYHNHILIVGGTFPARGRFILFRIPANP